MERDAGALAAVIRAQLGLGPDSPAWALAALSHHAGALALHYPDDLPAELSEVSVHVGPIAHIYLNHRLALPEQLVAFWRQYARTLHGLSDEQASAVAVAIALPELGVRNLRRQGLSVEAIARLYGVSPALALHRVAELEGGVDRPGGWEALLESPDACFLMDAEGRYLDVNPAACRLLGCSREEIVGKQAGAFSYPLDEGFPWPFTEALRRAPRVSGRCLTVLRDGSIAEVEVSAVANWQPARHLATVRRVPLSTVSDVVEAKVVSDAQGRIISATPAACLLLGQPESRLVGRLLVEFFPPGFNAQAARRALCRQRTRQGTVAIYRADGAVLPTRVTATANIVPGCTLTVLHPLGRGAALLDPYDPTAPPVPANFYGSPVSKLLYNDDLVYLACNEAACRLLGLAPDQIVGQPMGVLVDPKTLHVELLHAVARGEVAVARTKNVNFTHDGRVVDAEFDFQRNVFPGIHLCITRVLSTPRRDSPALCACLASGTAHDPACPDRWA